MGLERLDHCGADLLEPIRRRTPGSDTGQRPIKLIATAQRRELYDRRMEYTRQMSEAGVPAG